MDIFKAIMMTIFQILIFFALLFAGLCLVLLIFEHPNVFFGVIGVLFCAVAILWLFMGNLEKIKSKDDN